MDRSGLGSLAVTVEEVTRSRDEGWHGGELSCLWGRTQLAQFWSQCCLKLCEGNSFLLKKTAGQRPPRKGHGEMPLGRALLPTQPCSGGEGMPGMAGQLSLLGTMGSRGLWGGGCGSAGLGG